ncbi:Sec34-like family-domain-containing protein [Mycena leptocephala]|nr:Sec34-like family-domain-containing protein [Mycena leptocephala]
MANNEPNSSRWPARPAQRRGTAPVLNTPQARPVLNVEEWEAKAPLTDREITSVGILKAASEKAPLPYKFNDDEPGSSSRPSTPTRSRAVGPGSRPSSPMPPTSSRVPVQTPQQFYDWFALIDRSVAHSQEAHFRAHVASVSEHLDTCDRLVERIDEVDAEVDGMLDGWRGVEEGGKSLKDACERLLEERDRLLEMTDEIGTRLEYFQELEQATRMLNHLENRLFSRPTFYTWLNAWISRHFREAEIYLLRFQQCMTRAMTLIRMYFVGSLKALSVDVSKRMSEKDVSTTAQMHLLYTRFKSVSSQLSPLLGELERRAQAHPTELSALLTECHTAYFSVRKALLVGRLTEEIKGLIQTRAGQYLENLCDYLYDDLRPPLCEVCTVLQALMILDVATLADASDDDETPANELSKGLGQLHISHLLEMVLQDAQTRLFFKAQSEDLAYPDKLVGGRAPGGGPLQSKEKESFSQLFRLPTLDKQETWFPTLQKTVWVLAQLHDFVNPAIFEDIAQEAVTLCRQSLILASDMLKQRVGSSTSSLDGELFLVRHLLILKEITHNLDLAQRDGEDFQYGVTDTLASMLNTTTSLLPGALFASLGMPRSEEGIRDAKHGIDHDLKRVCEEVISKCATPICMPLHTWIDQIDAHNTRPQAAFQQPAAEELERAFRAVCERDLREQAARLRLYLEDDRTVGVLLQHIQDRIVDEYALFRDVVWNMYAGGMRAGVLSSTGLRELLKTVCGEEGKM